MYIYPVFDSRLRTAAKLLLSSRARRSPRASHNQKPRMNQTVTVTLYTAQDCTVYPIGCKSTG